MKTPRSYSIIACRDHGHKNQPNQIKPKNIIMVPSRGLNPGPLVVVVFSVCLHASVTFGSFSIIAFGTCCCVVCLSLWLLFMGIACIISIASWRLIINHPFSFLPQLVCVWRVLGSLFTMKANSSLGLWVYGLCAPSLHASTADAIIAIACSVIAMYLT